MGLNRFQRLYDRKPPPWLQKKKVPSPTFSEQKAKDNLIKIKLLYFKKLGWQKISKAPKYAKIKATEKFTQAKNKVKEKIGMKENQIEKDDKPNPLQILRFFIN